MKFSDEHFQSLKQAIIDTGIDLKATQKDYTNKGYSEIRFLWDVFWASKWSRQHPYTDYLDTHITSALRKAVKELLETEVYYNPVKP